ncbi:hypothetical protein COCNU_07G014130 [Cocos nucifera]|uniref:Uncharacterized protein n=1 Tax=Cocos nucifera TaxID=13894 RepID=A0A8K0IG89_COCNU|nr:hypothetical protein COCNU_07G014130 [Cocos nucifera]
MFLSSSFLSFAFPSIVLSFRASSLRDSLVSKLLSTFPHSLVPLLEPHSHNQNMDLPSDRSSGTSTFQHFMQRRILACQQDRRLLQHEIYNLEDRLHETEKHLEEIKAEARTSNRELFECVRDEVDVAWKCAKMKIDLEKVFGAQEIQKLWGTDESLMIDSKDPGAQSTDMVAKVECLLKNLESTGMNLKLPEVLVKELPEGSKSYHEVVESSKMPPGRAKSSLAKMKSD